MARAVKLGPVAAVVGFLVFVEFTSGILQGWYVPLLTPIARHLSIHDADVNWFEGSQLMLSALVVPALAKLGDMFGHRRMLLISTAIVAVAGIALAFTGDFWSFLIAWSLMGFLTVWLPLEIALIWSRSRSADAPAAMTRRAAGFLVAALEFGAIAGALGAGQLVDVMPLTWVLFIPGVITAICFFVVLFGVKESPDLTGGTFDTGGLVLISLSLLALTGGLSFMRINGPDELWVWGILLLGVLLLWPFARYELRHPDPLIDVRMFRDSSLWPVFLTAGLFGVSVLGAQAPLSTFAQTDAAEVGYGLSASSAQASYLIGAYLVSLIVGALLFPVVTRFIAPRIALIAASLFVAVGFLLFLPFHDSYLQVLLNMLVVGIGSGALVAALPAAAAAAAPAHQTGVATGLTNSVKTVGGAIASCVFGIALLGAAGQAAVESTAGSLEGYFTVWIVCGVTAAIAAVCLVFVPKLAFSDAPVAEPVAVR